MDNSQLVGNADVVVRGAAGATAEAGNGVTVVEMSAGKRRRGRPPRNQVRTTSLSAPPPPPQRKDEDDEEDVCFICFDGGSLVLCDRRGCPKAYHPACIKRDEAFFKSKAKWNCGWHICSTCQKASYYMCYTCTYSLCKNCTKDADYLNVQVDFDDKTSWEYLFKVYWVLLKKKLALSLDELTNAKNPWKETAIMGPKGNSSSELNNYGNAKGTNMEKSCGDQGDSYSKRRKTTRQQKLLNNFEYLGAENSGVRKGVPFPGGTNWATTELLEFVAHMKNGDVSVLSHFDVQALLLEYITRNNLRDPRQKSHIICDSRLMKLFGKERVGHLEMLKLLESHFLIQDHSRAIDTVRGEPIEAAAIQLAVDGNSDSQPIIACDKRRKTRKKVNEKGQRANPDEYAAVDVHNMNLIYLKRNWIENLIDDAEKIDGKVVGSFVRIKIPGNDQKQDFYRLVQVVGTSKAEPYKIGERTTDIMLEILNLDKKEAVSINGISNQEFTEDECQRLYQRIRCGLTKWFTVGEILEKAMALQAVRVNDWLQSEILRVTNLRDRASEKGHMKEYPIECIEKLQLLNSPDERQRRLQEIPDIHCDPDMNQYCKYLKVAVELEEKKENNKPRDSGFTMKEKEPAFPLKGSDDLNDIGSRGTSLGPHSTGMELTVNNIETDKIWHYQDPNGKVQGPFHIEMLRRWSMSGHFPPDLRIWRANEKQDNSILLTDALDGWYGEAKQSFCNSCVPTEDIRVASDDGCLSGAVDGSGGTDLNVAQIESKQVEGTLNSTLNNTSSHYCGNNESVKSTELSSQSSPCTATCTPVVDVVNSGAVQKGSPLPTCDLVKGDNDLPGLPQVSSSVPSSTLSDKPCGTQSQQFNNDHGVERWDNGSINMGENMDKTSEGQNIAGSAKLDDSEGKSGRSSGQSWRSSPLNDASNGWDSNSGLISLARALEASEHSQDIDFSDIPTSTSKLNLEDSKGQANESKLSLSLNVPHRDSGPSWSTTSSLVGNSQIAEIVGEWGGHSSTPAKPSAKEWDSNIVPGSSFKPSIMGSDHAAAPTSGSDQLTHSSPPDPANNAFAWDPIVPEPNEDDESVSDLLAEVEAMESLNGLTSPTSIMHCDGELAQGSEPDCFSPSTVTTEPFKISQSEVLDAQKSSGRHSSTSAEINENTRPRDVSVNQYKVGSNMQPPASPVTTWGMDAIDTAWRSGPETTSTNCGAVHGNKNFSWRGLGEGNTNVSRGTGQGTFQENSSINAGTSGENLAYWGSQQRYVSPRHRDFQGRDSSSVGGSDFHGRDSSSARGSDFQGKDSSSARGSDFQGRDSSSVRGSDFLGRDSSFARGRSSSNRHSSYYGGSNGGGTFRSPPKGQRICKFYESGYCKKGASMSLLAPLIR
ncbi:hypothetical protein GOBAR_DD28821 [Gossypium barbadense]|nr:hypothetical protein GOBAR_DD28821 [Gossypium barbadense]